VRTYIARGGFFQLGINGKLGWEIVGEDFFSVFAKKITITT
jgi:hypothetical protein